MIHCTTAANHNLAADNKNQHRKLVNQTRSACKESLVLIPRHSVLLDQRSHYLMI